MFTNTMWLTFLYWTSQKLLCSSRLSVHWCFLLLCLTIQRILFTFFTSIFKLCKTFLIILCYILWQKYSLFYSMWGVGHMGLFLLSFIVHFVLAIWFYTQTCMEILNWILHILCTVNKWKGSEWACFLKEEGYFIFCIHSEWSTGGVWVLVLDLYFQPAFSPLAWFWFFSSSSGVSAGSLPVAQVPT